MGAGGLIPLTPLTLTNVRVVGCRWAQELDELKGKRTRLLGDCLLGSSFLCYVGAFSWEFRHDMIYNMWWNDLVKRGVPTSKHYRLEDLLTNLHEISKYVASPCHIHSYQ